jgi:YidC/Oxa1 family membrane protein insertase
VNVGARPSRRSWRSCGRNRDDPRTLATESIALQRANGSGPIVGLLPGLAQAPFFMVMYRVALNAPAGDLFGIPLTAHLLAGWPVFLVLLAAAFVLARWSASRMSNVSGQLELLRHLPYLSLFAVAWLPLAGSIYLVTSTAWTTVERVLWRRPVTKGN